MKRKKPVIKKDGGAKHQFLYQLPSVIKFVWRWACIVAIVGYATSAIKAFAGQKTLAVLITELQSNFISLEMQIKWSLGLSWAMTVSSLAYGARQRYLRKKANRFQTTACG